MVGRNLLLTNPAIFCSLLVTFGTARLVRPDKEYLAQLHRAILAPKNRIVVLGIKFSSYIPEASLMIKLTKSKEPVVCQWL